MKPLRRVGREVLERARYWSGVPSLRRRLGAGGATILLFHSVAEGSAAAFVDPAVHLDPRAFARHLRFLTRRRRVIAFSQLLDELEAGGSPPAGTCVLTFDDGYRDTLEVAAPLLARHGLPATLFLPTGLIDRAEPQWVDRLHTALTTRSADRLELEGGAWDLRLPGQRVAARAALGARLLTADAAARERLLTAVEDRLRPRSRPPRLTLNWDEVRQLASAFPFEIGLHTVEHLDLASHPQAIDAELDGCARTLERELGRPARLFSFPYGRSTAEARERVRARGFRAAVADGLPPAIAAGTDRFQLPRVEAPASATLLRLRSGGVP